ncbi:MAG: TIGR03087 family PEP-CTERM/XrtA system glycosyltransferase [Pseudomonadota bacterium]|nr:TIGR03087 family PEP-CTERM/XrtA system glycosyltransferase [Pseudomonadota bacterium]
MSGLREILFLAHRIPYPPDKGDKIRSWRLVEHLSRRFRVHLAAFVDDRTDFAHEAFLAGVCESVFLVPLDPPAAKLRSAAGLVTGEPLSFPYFRDSRMQRRIDELRARGLAAEFAFSSAMAPYIAKPRGGRPRIVDLCDADSEKWRQYAAETGGPMSLIYAREAETLARRETEIIGWADAAFAVSAEEAAIFNARAGVGRSCDWFGNGVDVEHFRPSADRPAPEPSADIVFTGAMDYRANIDAVRWFAREVWPIVRAKAPEARFAIVGARPSGAVRALDGRDGVAVAGRVEDVRPWLQHASAVVAPLRIARGVQNKMLEAMAMARPVVATSGAAEGIDAREGEEFILADAPEAFAASVLWLMSDRKRGDAIGASARARMKAAYAWPARLSRLDAALARLGLD